MPNNKSKNKSLWITWETQRRNKELAKAFDCELKQFDYSCLNRLKRYIKSTSKTFQTIWTYKNKDLKVYAQCPSAILCLFLTFLKPIFKFVLIIDCHNAIFNYLNHNGPFIRLITIFFLKRADLLIVTNEYFKESVPTTQSKILVLPDKLPAIDFQNETPKTFSSEKQNVVFISSFSNDEPIYEFLKAAKELTNFARFFITGKKSKADSLLLSFESNDIVFTDYLSEKNYESLITHADVNIDLTTQSDLLVCGAYESLSAGVPCILSDTKIQREIFPEGYLYTFCDSESLKETILESFQLKNRLREEIDEFKSEFVNNWEISFKNCRQTIENL